MALRRTEIMKHEYIGPAQRPDAIIATYRTRKFGARPQSWTFRTVVLAGTHDCTILDWISEQDALTGHDQTIARLKRGEPLQQMLT